MDRSVVAGRSHGHTGLLELASISFALISERTVLAVITSQVAGRGVVNTSAHWDRVRVAPNLSWCVDIQPNCIRRARETDRN